MLRRPSQLLGIALGDRHAAAVVLERSGGGVRVVKSCAFALSLDILKDDRELAGRELRGHLDDAGIVCRRCIVCIPAKWLFTTQLELPELSEEDTASFLVLHADRHLPLPASDLMMASSRFRMAAGKSGVSILAVPASHLERLLGTLAAAHLRPVGVAIAAAVLAQEGSESEAVVLSLAKYGVELAVRAGGGIVSVRSLDEVLEGEGGRKVLDCASLGREMRITLGRLPEEVRSAVNTVTVYGAVRQNDAATERLREQLEGLGLSMRVGDSMVNGQTEDLAPGLTAATAQRLLGKGDGIEFLPAQPSRLARWTGPIAKRRSAALLGAVTIAVVVTLAGLWVQGRRLARLEEEWAALEPAAEEARLLREKIRTCRDWFESAPLTLAALADLTAAFPEDGRVWLRTLTIKGQSQVTCSGSAQNNQAWLDMLDALRSTSGVAEPQVSQVRGDAPLEFSLSYQRVKEGQQ